jgi:hypothetical protein
MRSLYQVQLLCTKIMDKAEICAAGTHKKNAKEIANRVQKVLKSKANVSRPYFCDLSTLMLRLNPGPGFYRRAGRRIFQNTDIWT